MALRFEILGKVYTQKQARTVCSEILNRHRPGDVVVGEDYLFLKNAFEKYHYNPLSKFPVPIAEIFVRKSESDGSSNSFWFSLENGVVDHIGFSKKCFLSDKKTNSMIVQDNVKEAARNEIRPQQDAARELFRKEPVLICGICGKFIQEADGLDADHAPPNKFKDILNNWLKLKGIKLESVEVTSGRETVTRFFKNEELALDWKEYHKSCFCPRPAHSICNVRLG